MDAILMSTTTCIYKDYIWGNAPITTRYGTSNIYYTSGANKLDIGIAGFIPVAATIQDWAAASAPISFYIASQTALGAYSTASQTCKIFVRVFYIKEQ